MEPIEPQTAFEELGHVLFAHLPCGERAPGQIAGDRQQAPLGIDAGRRAGHLIRLAREGCGKLGEHRPPVFAGGKALHVSLQRHPGRPLRCGPGVENGRADHLGQNIDLEPGGQRVAIRHAVQSGPVGQPADRCLDTAPVRRDLHPARSALRRLSRAKASIETVVENTLRRGLPAQNPGQDITCPGL